MALVLKKHGYNPSTVSNGIQALDFLERRPDVAAIITDIMMPEMDGLELLARVKEMAIGDIGLVVCSGVRDIEVIRKAGALGCRAYVLKPVTEQQLVEKVRIALQGPRFLDHEDEPIGDEKGFEGARRELARIMQIKAERMELLNPRRRAKVGFDKLAAELDDVAEGAVMLGARGLFDALERLRLKHETPGAKLAISDYNALAAEWDVLLRELNRGPAQRHLIRR